MTEQHLAYILIRGDGSNARDLDGVEIVFASRIEAERWLMVGERVERVKRYPDASRGRTRG